MLKAYHSGDPYLYFAKLAGAVPKDGTKEEYSRERNLFKSTCIRGDCLVRVKFHGYLQIKDIKKGMEVWDGQTWRKCRGAKYMGKKDTLLVEGAHATKDHLILTDSGWVENEFTAKERKGRKIYYKNAERLQRPSASWAEVWELGCYILKTIFKGK